MPGVSANISNPDPNPVPVGETASAAATFMLANDVGPISVSVHLRASNGSGNLRFDPDTTSSALTNCGSTGVIVTCDWAGLMSDSPQTIGVQVDVSPDSLPNQSWSIDAVVDNAQSSPQVLATQQLFVTAPLGSVSLSGHVVTTDNVPVNQACVFILANPPTVFGTVTDADGNWTVTDLPDDYNFVVGVIPPFDGQGGPCQSNGPPPTRAGRAATRVLRQHLD